MTKRPTLTNLQSQLASKRTTAPSGEGEAQAKPRKPSHKTAGKTSKAILVRINIEGWRELRKLAAELDETMQGVMIDAVNDYLREHGHPAVAENPYG
jgi:hypothetical protein